MAKVNKAAANAIANVLANVPAIVPGAPVASALPAVALASATGAAPCTAPATGWPAANNGTAWLALLAGAVPAILAARAHKYGAGAGLLPCQNNIVGLTAYGVTAASNGKGKSGRYTVQALLCVAHKLAQQATGQVNVCGAAVAYFAYTAPVLALLQPPHTKTAKYVGKPLAGGFNVPCPAWVNGYINGNSRAPALLFNNAVA